MKSELYPIEIGGRRFYVNTCFDNLPAIYEVKESGESSVRGKHVDTLEGSKSPALISFQSGDYIAYLTPAEEIENDPRFAKKLKKALDKS